MEFWERRFKAIKPDYKELSTEISIPVVNKLREYDCRRILDLGCGFGRWSIAMALAGLEVTAVDISPTAIDYLKEWAQKKKCMISTYISPLPRLLEIGSFDGVLAISVLDHLMLSDTSKTLDSIKQRIKSGGLILATFDSDEKGDYSCKKLSDNSIVYQDGPQKDMLWRYYSNLEIRNLFASFKILEFDTRVNDSRAIWAQTI